ncbi:hypothetical protein P886_3863 [Alteromonadaceae bacterium 2753L.S.0a.02]|nr:hypothetical protein P886_3863 [Alteromonadaceae bacterium 2753L.S.0a.02]
MILDHDELAQAIIFFGKDGLISKEMLYSEFEALLDGYVPAQEWAGQQAKATFVEIDSKFRVRTAIFFLVGFTKKGEIEPSWNIPLNQLSNNAMRGPDMGAGPIRLVCASQCPIQYFQESLWDPTLNAKSNQLNAIKKAIQRNKLAVQFRDNPDEELAPAHYSGPSSEQLEKQISKELRNEYAKEFRDHMAQMLKDQRLRTATILNDSQKSIASLKIEHSARIEEYRGLLDDKNRALQEEKDRNAQLKDTIEGQAKKIEGLREYFEHKLEKLEGEGESHASVLKENYQAEAEAKVEAATTELREMLQMREVELLYRNEQESQLRDEIARLRKQNQALLTHSGDELLNHMVAKGISFVSYQPGAGHITIPVADIASYMENPVAYAASQCGVAEELYKAWLEHYQAPVCTAQDDEGNLCSENIPRIANPADFHCGDQDRCNEHKELNSGKNLKLVSG